ncbi:MAG: hypothetical protein CVV44_18685 [Spirochaetae bacterium HGW-Spirochaetae-1]|nr:MAG: hypothetical protein CVV44_18685 [Spirochaetae bacterium HGW-Spirochaetae-1]
MNIQLFTGAFLSLAGILLTGLGLLFIIAATGLQSRIIAGIALCAGGIPFLFIGVRLFLRGLALTPGGIRAAILRLARLGNGELTSDVIIANLGDSATVRFQIEQMVVSGLAEKRTEGARELYIFSDFQAGLRVKQCPYCGNDYPVREDIESCPSCGGDLKMKNHRSGGDDNFSMDS